MSGRRCRAGDRDAPERDVGVDQPVAGETVLVASAGSPTRDAICLRLLQRHATGDDRALVVTTTESAAATVETHERRSAGPDDSASLALVDTTNSRPSTSVLYGDRSVVHLPSARDLERVIVGLSELHEEPRPSADGQYLVVRSLTPILEATETAHASAALDRITGIHDEPGLSLLGVDRTAHDEETLRAIVDGVDAVLWVTEATDDELAVDYRPTEGRSNRAVLDAR